MVPKMIHFKEYSVEDLDSLLSYIRSKDTSAALNSLEYSMELRLESFIDEIISCITDNSVYLLSMYKAEIDRITIEPYKLDVDPKISIGIHVPNWVAVLFIPFDALPLYLHLPSSKYRAAIAWRFNRGE